MYKKIIAMCLALIFAFSLTAAPVLAEENANITTITKQGANGVTTIQQIIVAVKKDKKDKNDDLEDLVKSIMKKFLDSDEYNWAQKSIEKLGALGVINGNGNGYFLPKNNVTHAEAIAMVLKLTGYQKQAEAIKKQPEYFKNMCDPWSYGYLQLALDQGIIIPEEDGKFNPNTPAKRHEVAKYVVRALGKRDLALKNMKAKLKYKDASSIPSKSVGYVYVITDLGIMQGSDNQFQANKPITRAEMAVILDKAEGITTSPDRPNTSADSIFVAYDKNTNKLTLSVNSKTIVYDINPSVPVYKDSTYYPVTSLNPGDIIKVIVDSQGKVIFIEFKQQGTNIPVEEKLAMQAVSYNDLPQALKDRVDALKLTQSFTAIRYDQSIYLIAARGQMPTGGYGINIKQINREKLSTGKYNLKAITEATNPGSDFVTQAITYPYSIVKIAYFDGIEKINFVDAANSLLAQATINNLDVVESISGKIHSVDAAYRTIRLLESDGNVRVYLIPTGAQITLENKAARLSDLEANMTAVVTRVNGVVTSLAVKKEVQVIETINGKIDTVDAANRIIKVVESDNVTRAYLIPSNVQITLNNQNAALTSLIKDMPIVITKTNGIITKLAAANIVEAINGKVDSVDTTNRIIKVLENDGVVRAYQVTSSVAITVNDRSAALSSLMKDMPVVLTRTNGILTKIAATNIVETISGKLDSVDAANRIIKVQESDNVVRAYLIPATVQITLNNQRADLLKLAKDMTVVLTRTNGVITNIAATNIVETISGKVDSVDTTNNIVKILEADNTVKAYTIPTTAQITVDNQAATLANLTKGMLAVITKSNGIITTLTAARDIKTVEGVLVTTYSSQDKTFISVKVSNLINAYEITSATAIYYNNQSTTIQSIPLNSTIVIKIENGAVIEVRNK